MVAGGGGVALGVSSLLPCGRSRSRLLGCGRRHGHEKVDLPTLELRVGRHRHYLRDDPFFRGRGGLLQYMLGMGLHDLAGGNGAADFLNMAIGVYYPDHVESPAWKNARDAAPDRVLHDSSLCNSHREREEEEEEEERKR